MTKDVRCNKCMTAMTDNAVALDKERQIVGGYLRCPSCGYRVEYSAEEIASAKRDLLEAAGAPPADSPPAVVGVGAESGLNPTYDARREIDGWIRELEKAQARNAELESENAKLRAELDDAARMMQEHLEAQTPPTVEPAPDPLA